MIEVDECLVIVGIDEEGLEATIGVGLPCGGSPYGVFLWVVLFGLEVKGCEGERAVCTFGRDMIPPGVALSRISDAVNVGELDGERLLEGRIAASSAFLLEEGEAH